MTKQEANSKVVKLFNKWNKEFRNCKKVATEESQEAQEFRMECARVHYIYGLYEVITDKNALKMASICSAIRFVEPFRMLMKLQKTTGTY